MRLNRRRFLKYVGLGAAVVGAGLAGYEFDRWQNSVAHPSVSTRTIMETKTLRQTTTETIRLASLHGRLFFDYNGNGAQDGKEPAVAGALVQLKDNAGGVVAEALTDSSGDYELQDARTGSYRLHVGVDHFSDKQLTYMCTSPDEFRAVSEHYDISIQESMSMDIGLMERFLTQPVSSKTHFNSSRLLYDWNPDAERSLWWNGKAGNDTQDHGGHDYDMRDNEPVLAAAPGRVQCRSRS